MENNTNKVLEYLKKQALYAQRSFSRDLLFECYGQAKMALTLEAITYSEFMEINRLTVVFMNTDRQFIKSQRY